MSASLIHQFIFVLCLSFHFSLTHSTLNIIFSFHFIFSFLKEKHGKLFTGFKPQKPTNKRRTRKLVKMSCELVYFFLFELSELSEHNLLFRECASTCPFVAFLSWGHFIRFLWILMQCTSRSHNKLKLISKISLRHIFSHLIKFTTDNILERIFMRKLMSILQLIL